MGGGKHELDQNYTSLSSAFKRLKVNPKWTGVTENRNELISIQDLWAGHSHAKTQDSDKKKSKKSETTNLSPNQHRMTPYPLECITTIRHLSIRTEQCGRKSCGCNKNYSWREATNTQRNKLNFANVCTGNRKIIRDSRLKLHNAEKDHKTVLRAARLKFLKNNKTLTSKQLSPLTNSLLCQDVPDSDKHVFGGHSCSPLSNFTKLAQQDQHVLTKERPPWKSKAKTARAKQSEHEQQTSQFKPCLVFNDTAHAPTLTFSNTDNSDSSVPLNITETSVSSSIVDRSCSQEARVSLNIEDMSVAELASYFENFVYIPKKMSSMAEMMYT